MDFGSTIWDQVVRRNLVQARCSRRRLTGRDVGVEHGPGDLAALHGDCVDGTVVSVADEATGQGGGAGGGGGVLDG